LRAVLDPNVIISATLSPGGSPGRLFRHWLKGAYDLVVSPLLLDELGRALGYTKPRDRVSATERREILELLARAGVVVEDPALPPAIQSPDPGDDYLVALASISRSVLVSGDADLLGLSDQIPVYSPAEFLVMMETPDSNST
jgi:putative PIN family toxin of toxin-antitoxin system